MKNETIIFKYSTQGIGISLHPETDAEEGVCHNIKIGMYTWRRTMNKLRVPNLIKHRRMSYVEWYEYHLCYSTYKQLREVLGKQSKLCRLHKCTPTKAQLEYKLKHRQLRILNTVSNHLASPRFNYIGMQLVHMDDNEYFTRHPLHFIYFHGELLQHVKNITESSTPDVCSYVYEREVVFIDGIYPVQVYGIPSYLFLWYDYLKLQKHGLVVAAHNLHDIMYAYTYVRKKNQY